MADLDIISPIEPASVRPARGSYSGLAIWFMIMGGALFVLFALAAIIFTVRGLIDSGSLAERLSGIPLYLFVGSFGMVPGALLYIWGRALKRGGPSRALAAALPIFTLPLVGLAIFVSRFDGWIYSAAALLCVLISLVISIMIWRATPPQAES